MILVVEYLVIVGEVLVVACCIGEGFLRGHLLGGCCIRIATVLLRVLSLLLMKGGLRWASVRLHLLVVYVVRGVAMELWGQEDDVGMGEVEVGNCLELAAGAGMVVVVGMEWWVLRVGVDTVGVEGNGDVAGLLLTDGRIRTVDDEGQI